MALTAPRPALATRDDAAVEPNVLRSMDRLRYRTDHGPAQGRATEGSIFHN